MNSARDIAAILLDKHAVTLNTTSPYTYVSGIRSPIYCDNRRIIFFPEERRKICQAFSEQIRDFQPEVIAGTATSAIPWAAWVAAELELPLVYIRKAAKGYGKDQLIEGGEIAGKTVVVLEDLVSTGGSSLSAVEACRAVGATVSAMVAIFTYEFEAARRTFQEAVCEVRFLTNFSALTQVAADQQLISQDELTLVREWNQDPQGWGPRHGFPNQI